MHEKIIEVNRRKDFQVEDRISELNWNFDNGFVGWIADYISDVDDFIREEVISDFKESMDNSMRPYITLHEDCIIFKKGFKDAHAKKMLDSLREIVASASVENMRTGLTRVSIQEIMGDPWGLYIYDNDIGLCKLNVWLSEWLEEDIPYMFGGVLDYHY